MATNQQDEIQTLRDMITAGWRTRLIHAGVVTGLFDALSDEPQDASALAAELGLHEETVSRVLRALSTLGVCDHSGLHSFAITPMGSLLKTDAEVPLRSLSLHWGGRVMSSLATIVKTLETGEPGRGGGDFDSLNATPFDAYAFNQTMADQSRPVAKVMAKMHDFSAYDTVMDVGGGYGGLISEVMLAYPDIKGAIYDLPAVEQGADPYLTGLGIRGRVNYIPGSFFENVAPGADCLLLKFILHDWDDAECATIMANCRAAMEPGTRLLVVERIMPERATAQNEDVVRQDMVMMPISGKERTLAEMERMGVTAGFTLGKVTALIEGCSLIEMHAA